jgi:hypothetical protein
VLSKELKKIALKAIKILNYDIAGVDIIYRREKPAVLEVNASPGLKGFSKATGINTAEKIVVYMERRFTEHQKKLKKKKFIKSTKIKDLAREKSRDQKAKNNKIKKDNDKKKWWQKNISEIFGSD